MELIEFVFIVMVRSVVILYKRVDNAPDRDRLFQVLNEIYLTSK